MDDFVVVGLSHKSAPIAVREKLAFNEDGREQALVELAALGALGEVMLLSTCNRVEIFATAKQASAATTVLEHLIARGGEVLRPHLYQRAGDAAVIHLFQVAASLDSMVVGEPQILGQVKEAFDTALKLGFAQGELARACQAAFGAAKRVRTETTIGAMSVSMASVAVELAQKIFGALAGRTVLVVGAGPMSALCARHLAAESARVLVANRTLSKAEALAAEVGARAQARPFESLPALLVEADIVISSTAAPQPLFVPEGVAAALKARKNRPLFFVDLAVPRDVDPAVGKLEHVFAYDVDDLERVVAEHLAARTGEAAQASLIVAEEVARFIRARTAREAVPILAQLRQHADEVGRAEAEKTLAFIGEALSEKQKKSVEAMARAIVNKLLHEPTARLRTAGAAGPEEAARLARAAAELFGLSEAAGEGDEAPADSVEPASTVERAS